MPAVRRGYANLPETVRPDIASRSREVAPRAGLEPATNGLTVRRSTTELPGNRWEIEGARFCGKHPQGVKARCRKPVKTLRSALILAVRSGGLGRP